MKSKVVSKVDFKLLVVIPVYNCQAQITRVLSQIPLVKFKISEVLVIDNISSDQTLIKAKIGLKKLTGLKVKLWQNSQNISLGGSHQVAFQYAAAHDFSHLLICHGDDQANLADFKTVLTTNNLDFDAVLGSRFMAGAKLENYNLIREWGNLILNWLFSWLVGQKITDTGAGLNLYKVAAFSPKVIQTFPRDLTFNAYLLLWSLYKKHKLRFQPISWRETDQVSQAKIWQQGWRICQILIKYRWSALAFFQQLKLNHQILPQIKIIFEKN